MVLTSNSTKPKAASMRILMRQSVIGTGGDVWHVGQEYAAPAALAHQLVRRGAAESVAPKAQPKQEPKAEPNPLDGVDFASDPAAELAIAEGLALEDFDGIDPSSSSGYTKPDVQAILELRNGG